MRFIFFVLLSSGVFHAALSNDFVKLFEKWFSDFYEDEYEAHYSYHSSGASNSPEFDLHDIFSSLVELDFDDCSEESDDPVDEMKPPVITGPSWLITPTSPEVGGPVNFPGSPGEVEQQEKPSPEENDGQRPTFPPLPPYYLPQNQHPELPPSNSVQSIPNVPPPAAAAPIIPPPNSNATLHPEDSLILAMFNDEVDDTDGPGVIDGDEEVSG